MCAGVVEDVLLVPVNISYDKILERSFVKDELMVCVWAASVRVWMCLASAVHRVE